MNNFLLRYSYLKSEVTRYFVDEFFTYKIYDSRVTDPEVVAVM